MKIDPVTAYGIFGTQTLRTMQCGPDCVSVRREPAAAWLPNRMFSLRIAITLPLSGSAEEAS
jgi:hypothetical protein